MTSEHLADLEQSYCLLQVHQNVHLNGKTKISNIILLKTCYFRDKGFSLDSHDMYIFSWDDNKNNKGGRKIVFKLLIIILFSFHYKRHTFN